ncbi:MAG: hypothetical protein PHE56_11250 [Bacteroidales bacterium]|nr:hypothetical protein [Bacteroidales bacterium]
MRTKSLSKLMLFLILILLISLKSFAQSDYIAYYNALVQAQTYEANEDYEAAYQLYRTTLTKAYPFPDEYIATINCCLRTHHINDIPNLIKELILHGYKPEEIIYPFSFAEDGTHLYGYNHFPFPPYQHYFDSIYPEERANYLSHERIMNNQYLNSLSTLEEMIYRQRSFDMNDTLLENSYLKLLLPYLLEMENLTTDVSRRSTDTWLDMKFLAGLLHTGQVIFSVDTAKYQQFEVFLWNMVLQGNIHIQQYAVIVDAIQNINNRVGIYGEQRMINSFNNPQLAPVKDIENVDSIRASILLPPLWVKCKLTNVKPPEGYKQK